MEIILSKEKPYDVVKVDNINDYQPHEGNNQHFVNYYLERLMKEIYAQNGMEMPKKYNYLEVEND